MKTEKTMFRHVKFAWDGSTNSVILDFGATVDVRKVANRRNGWHLALHSRCWYWGDVTVSIRTCRVAGVDNIEDWHEKGE